MEKIRHHQTVERDLLLPKGLYVTNQNAMKQVCMDT